MIIKFQGGPLNGQSKQVEDNVKTFKVATRVMKRFKFDNRSFDIRVATIQEEIYSKGGLTSDGCINFIHEPLPEKPLQVYVEDK